MPIEILVIGKGYEATITEAIDIANRLQGQFEYSRLKPEDGARFVMLQFERIKAPEFLDSMVRLRKEARGYHPFMIVVVDAPVDGSDFTNLFCSSRGEAGLGVLTSANVPKVIGTRRIDDRVGLPAVQVERTRTGRV